MFFSQLFSLYFILIKDFIHVCVSLCLSCLWGNASAQRRPEASDPPGAGATGVPM